MKNGLIAIALAGGVVIVAALVYLGIQAGDKAGAAMVTVLPTKTATVYPTQAPSPTTEPTPTVAIKKGSEANIVADIKEQLANKYGLRTRDFAVTVSRVEDGRWAKGSVREVLEQAGGYWLASFDKRWNLVYDGQSQPRCSDVDSKQFPVDMVPECQNGSKVVKR